MTQTSELIRIPAIRPAALPLPKPAPMPLRVYSPLELMYGYYARE